MMSQLKRLFSEALYKLGFQLVRNTRPRVTVGFSHGENASVPPAFAERLTLENERLLELRSRYRNSTLPMAVPTLWDDDYLSKNLELKYFRGDNAYVWQTRHMGDSVAQRYYLYLLDVEARDELGLLEKLDEDEAFGAWVYRYHRNQAVSRDLLDSINELNFLERHMGLSGIEDLQMLDIGAGYGRMAHRSCQALPNLSRYFCIDAVAESTFISELYLEYRECLDRVEVLPLDRVDALQDKRIDVVINIHSFSEMSLAAIQGWFDVIKPMKVPYLFIVPNDPEAFLTLEADGKRRDYLSVIEQAGYQLKAKEPVIVDHDSRELIGVNDHQFLFELVP